MAELRTLQRAEKLLAIVQAGVATANATGHVSLNASDVQTVASTSIDAIIAAVKVVQQAHGR